MDKHNLSEQEQGLISEEQQIIDLSELGLTQDELTSLKKKLKKLQGRDDRAFMDMLRVTSRNHYTLNQMVDRKARIMLSINIIILSLIISRIVGIDDLYGWVFLLLITLGTACLGSIIYAMLAVLPERSHGELTEESIKEKKGNPLFFGNFKNMSEANYENTLMEMVNDRDFIYRSIIQDIYHLGQVLERKRVLLRGSLYIFICGLCIALLLSLLLRLFVGAQLL